MMRRKVIFKGISELEEYCSNLTVTTESNKPHQIISQLIKKKGRGKPYDCWYFKVSHEQFARAIALLDTILKAVEKWEPVTESKMRKKHHVIF